MKKISMAIEEAVRKTIADGLRTADIMSPGCRQLTTQQMGDEVLKRLS